MIPDSNVSAIHPAAGLPVVPTPKPAPTPTPVPSSAARDTTTGQKDQTAQKDNWTVSEGPKEFWLEVTDDTIWHWSGIPLKGPVLGLACYSYFINPRPQDYTFFATDDEEFVVFKVGALHAFLAAHADKIIVSVYDKHFRPDTNARGQPGYRDSRWEDDRPDPYVSLFYLNMVRFPREMHSVGGNQDLTPRMLELGCADAVTQGRLRNLWRPAVRIVERHAYVCTMWGQALSGVLLYRLYRQEILSAVHDRQRNRGIQTRLASLAFLLPAAVVADLTRPVDGVVLDQSSTDWPAPSPMLVASWPRLMMSRRKRLCQPLDTFSAQLR